MSMRSKSLTCECKTRAQSDLPSASWDFYQVSVWLKSNIWALPDLQCTQLAQQCIILWHFNKVIYLFLFNCIRQHVIISVTSITQTLIQQYMCTRLHFVQVLYQRSSVWVLKLCGVPARGGRDLNAGLEISTCPLPQASVKTTWASTNPWLYFAIIKGTHPMASAVKIKSIPLT